MHGPIARELKSHIWKREENEHYVEPAWCSRRLFQEEKFIGCIDDPCCGFGTILKSAEAEGFLVNGSDIVDRGWPNTAIQDFFTETIHSDNIVCNPPFNIADKFALHALKLAKKKVALIFPTARLNAAHWLKGTPLARVWLLSPRPSMPPGHVIARGEKPGDGKTDFCWLVFEHRHPEHTSQHTTELRWLYRDKP